MRADFGWPAVSALLPRVPQLAARNPGSMLRRAASRLCQSASQGLAATAWSHAAASGVAWPAPQPSILPAATSSLAPLPPPGVPTTAAQLLRAANLGSTAAPGAPASALARARHLSGSAGGQQDDSSGRECFEGWLGRQFGAEAAQPLKQWLREAEASGRSVEVQAFVAGDGAELPLARIRLSSRQPGGAPLELAVLSTELADRLGAVADEGAQPSSSSIGPLAAPLGAFVLFTGAAVGLATAAHGPELWLYMLMVLPMGAAFPLWLSDVRRRLGRRWRPRP